MAQMAAQQAAFLAQHGLDDDDDEEEEEVEVGGSDGGKTAMELDSELAPTSGVEGAASVEGVGSEAGELPLELAARELPIPLLPRVLPPPPPPRRSSREGASWGVAFGQLTVRDGECAVCREGSVGSSDRGGTSSNPALGALGWVAHVSVCSTLKVGGGGSIASSTDSTGSTHTGASRGPSASSVDDTPGLHVLCCGHKMHSSCYANHRWG